MSQDVDREPGSSLPLPAQLRFDAGSPALNLLATRGYRGTAEPVERLGSVQRLRDWCRGAGLVADRRAAQRLDIDDGTLRDARELREAGYLVLAAALAARPPTPRAVAVINKWATLPGPQQRLVVRDGTWRWSAPAPTVPELLAGLAAALGELAVQASAATARGRRQGDVAAADGPVPGEASAADRTASGEAPAIDGSADLYGASTVPVAAGVLRMCTAPTCRMIYLDRSRGARRRWCSMARCGNRAKVARHRDRAATASSAAEAGS